MNRNKMKMNKNLLIVFVFLLFNLGYGQTIDISTGILSVGNSVYGETSRLDSFVVSGTNIDQKIEVTPPFGYEVSRNGTVFTDTTIINTPTGGRGDIAATLIYIRLKGTIPAGVYGGVYFYLTSPGSENAEILMGASTVNKNTLTIVAGNKSRLYGDSNPDFTVSYSGFKNGDNETNLTAPIKIGTIADKTSAVGIYDITVTGGESPNYVISNYQGKLTIKKASLTIITKDNSKVYGSINPDLTVAYSGFVNGDNETNLTTPVKIETSAITTSPVGKYEITASGATSSNYEISYSNPNGSLTVTPAKLTITTKDSSKVYGSVNPDLTAVYSGFVNGDNETKLTIPVKIETTAITTSPVGKYEIKASGAVSSNYEISYGTSNGFLTINPADLTITADRITKKHGENNPALTVQYSGFVNQENESNLTTQAIITTTAKTDSAIGEYPITVSGATSLNYNIKFVDNILEVIASTDAGLSDIVISNGNLDKPVDAYTKDYTVKVPNEVNTYLVNPVPSNPNATVEMIVEGKVVDPSYPIDLKVGDNPITIVVTAEDGTTQETYTVIVTREPSNNSGLTDLVPSEGALSPVFSEGNIGYTNTVPNEIKSITLTPVTSDPIATVTINGKPVPSGTASADLPLKVGENTITTVVTAEDGTTTTYTVVVKREPSDNSGLTNLAISEGTLSPAFAEGTTAYTATVANNIENITVTPITADPTATITVNGIEVPSGTASADLPLKVGENTITTVVTAEDGTTTTYTVIVIREPSGNTGLADIVVSDGALNPVFNTDINDYQVDVPYETDSIVITPVTIDPTATVTMIVDGQTVDPTEPLDLNVGDNLITVVVTAEDGTQETYTVIVNRADDVPPVIVPSNIITPNGDGKNDIWIIPGIDKYPANSVKVFDRAARLVYSKEHYNNEWDGTYKGSPLTQDTYYYLIDLGSGLPKIKGFITIVRD
jgi:gliding motility-associated-like protein